MGTTREPITVFTTDTPYKTGRRFGCRRRKRWMSNYRVLTGRQWLILYTCMLGMLLGAMAYDAWQDLEWSYNPASTPSGRQLLAANPNISCDSSFDKNGGIAVYFLGSLYMFIGLAIVCDDYFVQSLEAISEALSLSEDVAGATFMAAGSSAPELATSFVSTFTTESTLGAGTIVGSAVFNILIIVALTAVFSGQRALQLDWRPLIRDSVFYAISIGMIAVFFWNGEVDWWEALILLFGYVGYITFMVFNARLLGHCAPARRASVAHADELDSDDDDGDEADVPVEPRDSTSNNNNNNNNNSKGDKGDENALIQDQGTDETPRPREAGEEPHSTHGSIQQQEQGREAAAKTESPSPTTPPADDRPEAQSSLQRRSNKALSVNVADEGEPDGPTSPQASNTTPPASDTTPATAPAGASAGSTLTVQGEPSGPGSVPASPSMVVVRGTTPSTSPRPSDTLAASTPGGRGQRATSQGNPTTLSASVPARSNSANAGTAPPLPSKAPPKPAFAAPLPPHLEKGERGTAAPLPHTHADDEDEDIDIADDGGGERRSNAPSPVPPLTPTGRTTPATGTSTASSLIRTNDKDGEAKEEGDDGDDGDDDDDDDDDHPLAWPDTWGARIWYIVIFPYSLFFWITIPNCETERWKKWYAVTFIMSIVWIGALSFFMVDWAERIGCIIGIDSAVMGLTFVAAGTSVPDALSSLSVAREGQGDMAVSNAIGSNVFDILLGLGLPWFVYSAIAPQRAFIVNADGILVSVFILLGVLVAVIACVWATGWRLHAIIGYIFLVMYLLFFAWSLINNLVIQKDD